MFSRKKAKINYLKTFGSAIEFFKSGLISNTEFICDQYDKIHPDLFITDFEPSIARAASYHNKPLISIDNQHRFIYSKLDELSLQLKLYGWMCGLFANLLVPNPNCVIVSSFYSDKIKKANESVTFVGGILRKIVEEQQPTNGDFVLVYSKNYIADDVLKHLLPLKDKFVVYGASCSAPVNFEFKKISPDFVKDLAKCKCVISTAGHQLISEARYYKKPVLVIPEPCQYEQYINAFFVDKIGLGKTFYLNDLNTEVIKDFIENFSNNSTNVQNGVIDVVNIINRFTNEKN